MAYRSGALALQARHAALEAEVAERTRMRDEVARMLADARDREWSDAYLADLAAGGPARRRQRRMTRIAGAVIAILAVVGIVAMAASYRHHVMHHGVNRQAVEIRLILFTEQMCECKTAACATELTEQMSRWSIEMSKDAPADFAEMSSDDAKRWAQIGERMGTCMQAALAPPVDHVAN